MSGQTAQSTQLIWCCWSQMLSKKVDTLTKAMEVEAKKMRREVAAMEKELAALRVEREQESRARRLSKGVSHSSSQTTARSAALL